MLQGFTLIEVLIALGLLGTLAAVSGIETIGSFRTNLERAAITHSSSFYSLARNQAIHHICEGHACTRSVPHGIYLSNTMIKFQGDSFETRDKDYDVLFPANNKYGTSTETVYFPDGTNTTQ